MALSFPKSSFNDDDEPYSPRDSDENDVFSSIVDTSTCLDQQTVIGQEVVKLDQIKREIEARRMEIAGMLNDNDDMVCIFRFS